MAQSGRSWLSQRAQELVVRSDRSKAAGEPFDCDLLIVGSGYGGAVAAARASGHRVRDDKGKVRPARVWVLERGNEYLPGMFPSRFSEIAGHVRFDMQDGRRARGVAEGLFDARIGPDVSVLLGSGLGGGSLINAGVMARPDPWVFDSMWPNAFKHVPLDNGYDSAWKMLKPEKVPENRECDKFRSFKTVVGSSAPFEAAPVTVHWRKESNAAGVQMEECTLCGDCLTGCNQSAKGSLDTNYLAYARARGVEMFCGGTVDSLARDGKDCCWEVSWRYTDPALRPADGKPFIVRAKRVVLAAGSLGSTEILLRSKARLKWLSGWLGMEFSANGGRILASIKHPAPVRSVGHEEADPADCKARHVGPTITGIARVKLVGSLPFVVEEFSVPAGLRHVFGEVVALLATLCLEPIGSADPLAVTDADIDRIGLYGFTGDDGAKGRLELPAPASADEPSEGIRIGWSLLWRRKMIRLHERMQVWLGEQAELAGAVAIPDDSELGKLMPYLPALTVHPLGGCCMGDSRLSGVVDDCGRVFEGFRTVRSDLVILDGSIVPEALGINPAFTIAAIAERAMPVLLEEWKKDDWLPGGAHGSLDPRPPGRRRDLPAAEVVWSIRERLQGLFAADDGRFFWARMEIEFEDIPGFRRVLALQPREVTVRRAVLELFPAKEGDDEFTVDEPSTEDSAYQPVCRAELAGTVLLFEPGDDGRSTLDYRLVVRSLDGDPPPPLAIGGCIRGVKTLHLVPTGNDISPWRELTEMEVHYNEKGIGRWALDLEDLAQRREPLLRIVRLSSMPDALDDAAAIALYVARRNALRLLKAIDGFRDKRPKARHLNKRWPRRIRGAEYDVRQIGSGARVTRYRPDGKRAPEGGLPPVLLIHGLGSSGASVTDESMPNSLAATLLADGREVWVLDVRSSIGNEYARHGDEKKAALEWTVDSVAKADLPAAIDLVYGEAGEPIDVLAHCMGAVMFCIATLGDEDCRMKGKLRAVVLSQVGPLIRLSPFNRLRGYVASYLQQFLQIDTVDTCPHFESNDGGVHWSERKDVGIAQLLIDGLLSMFPYPDDDDEAAREAANPELQNTDFRRIRHRGDAILGQLFELKNLSDDALARLEVFLGWAMVPMLSQAIHFARRNMITDATGNNSVMHANNFHERFSFPLLIIHGRRNRVFNWRGSLASWKMLKKLRGEEWRDPPIKGSKGTLYGADTPTQLAVFDCYGHFDCMLGQHAHTDIFGVVSRFFADAQKHKAESESPPTQFEAPWIGPMIGWVRPELDEAGVVIWVGVRLLVHPPLRRTRIEELVIVPVRNVTGVPQPQPRDACVVKWPKDAKRHAGLDLFFSADGLSGDMRNADRTMRERTDTFVLLTMHRDLPLDVSRASATWLKNGKQISDDELRVLEPWIADPGNAEALANGRFSLAPNVVRAADLGKVTGDSTRISFALASCQYPAGLFDVAPAAASYERLLADATQPDGPQFLVLCGDQVYVDAAAGLFDPGTAGPQGGDLKDAGLDRTYEPNWRMTAFRRTTARLPTVAMLDDHEVHDNWKGSPTEPPPDHVENALDAYERHQGLLNPQRPLIGAGAAGLSYVFYPGGVPFIVLDTRSKRSPRSALDIDRAKIIPDAAMAALQELLQNKCWADSVKFIVSPSPILPPEHFVPEHPAERLRSDNWSGYPASTRALLQFIGDNNVRRVVFLSGDAHLSCVCSFEFNAENADHQVVSVVSSGMYAPWPFANQRHDELALSGSVDLGLPKSPLEGRMRLHAISTANGYALVSVEKEDADVWLNVSLRAASGATTDCRVKLT